jgi:zinc transport system substrate-binding protein
VKRFKVILFLILSLICLIQGGCKKEKHTVLPKKINVIVTLFPIYDFAKNVGAQYINVNLLLPPGVEPHSFEPSPEDIIKIDRADIFIYTGKYMEPWAEKILKGIDKKNLIVADCSKGIQLKSGMGGDNNNHEGHVHKLDPHIWLDFENAKKMVDNILEALIEADKSHNEYYINNAEIYKSKLTKLDERFKESLSSCKMRYFVHGGHYTFGYLARRYGLHYISVYEAFSPNAEPTAQRLSMLINTIKKYNTKYIFYEELISPKLAETISKETGVKLLKLHGAHNLTKDEWEKGFTFIDLMEQNLSNLRLGLQCQ